MSGAFALSYHVAQMWYSSSMNDMDLEAALREAWAAVSHAREVRKRHARQTDRGTAQREADLRIARQGIDAAMRPLRSEIGRTPYAHIPREDEIREASKALQAERRKLWKMQDRRRTK
jgi:hypothetical protein